MGDFGELVLLIGDLHIPHRKSEVPDAFKTLLTPGKVQHVLCTGNLSSKGVEDYLRSLANNVHFAKGDLDVAGGVNFLTETKVIKIGEFSIGMVHGHQIIPWGDIETLGNLQRKLDVDILITGHTHKSEVFDNEGKLIINPGSATGAHSAHTTNVIPSFIILGIKGPKVTLYLYEIRDGDVVVAKSEFSKKSSTTTSSPTKETSSSSTTSTSTSSI